MHPQSPALTIGGTELKESDDLVILGVTFDSKMTFEKHLCSVSRAASQWLGILRKSWQVFYDSLLLGRCVMGFVLPVLEYSSAVWCSTADTHLKLLDLVVSGASLLTGVCLSVTLHIVDLWQYYVCCTRSGVIRCTIFMVLFLCRMCRCWLHVRSGVIAHRYTYVPRRCRTSQYLRSFIHLSVSLWTIFVTPYSMVWDWRVSRIGQCLFIGLAARSLCVSWCFRFLFFQSLGWFLGLGSSDW